VVFQGITKKQVLLISIKIKLIFVSIDYEEISLRHRSPAPPERETKRHHSEKTAVPTAPAPKKPSHNSWTFTDNSGWASSSQPVSWMPLPPSLHSTTPVLSAVVSASPSTWSQLPLPTKTAPTKLSSTQPAKPPSTKSQPTVLPHPPSSGRSSEKQVSYHHTDILGRTLIKFPYVNNPTPLNVPTEEVLKRSFPSALNGQGDSKTYKFWKNGIIPHWTYCQECFNGRISTARGMKGHQKPFTNEASFLQHLKSHRPLTHEEARKIETQYSKFTASTGKEQNKQNKDPKSGL